MRTILIAYGTTDGHTAKIAKAMAETLRAAGVEVDVFDTAGETKATARDASNYSAVIVSASVHAGGYQRSVVQWVKRNTSALNVRPTAFVSVCLGVLQHEPAVNRELTQIMERFLEATGWTPTVRKVVAGALLYRQYNLIKRWVMRRIVAKAKGDTDTSRDYEYTDWDDLTAFARHFCDQAQLQSALTSPAAAIA